MGEALPPLPDSAYPPDSHPIPVLPDWTARLVLSWTLFVLAWPAYEIADVHDWYVVLGLVVVVRMVALYLGVTALRAMRVPFR